MGLFGGKKRQIDALLSGPMMGAEPMTASGSMPMPQMAPQAPQMGYQRHSTGKMILGSIGDALSQWGGGQATFGPMLQQRQLMAQRAQQAQLDRANQFADWERQQKWKRENPDPRYFEANNGDQYQIGPDGQPKRIFADPTPKVTMMAVDNGDGTKTITPFANGVPLGQGVPPQAQPGMSGGLPPGYTKRPKGGAGSGQRSFPIR